MTQLGFKSEWVGALDRNRTCNCPLGGGRYIHLTIETNYLFNIRSASLMPKLKSQISGDN